APPPAPPPPALPAAAPAATCPPAQDHGGDPASSPAVHSRPGQPSEPPIVPTVAVAAQGRPLGVAPRWATPTPLTELPTAPPALARQTRPGVSRPASWA